MTVRQEFTHKDDLKTLLIRKICFKIGESDKPLPYYDSSSGSLYPNFKTELLKLDFTLKILAYAENVWIDVHRLLGIKNVPTLIGIGNGSKEEIEFAEELQMALAKVSQSIEKELSKKTTELSNSQTKINSLQNDLTTKDSELTDKENQKIINRSIMGIFILSILCLLLFCLSWKRKVGKRVKKREIHKN